MRSMAIHSGIGHIAVIVRRATGRPILIVYRTEALSEVLRYQLRDSSMGVSAAAYSPSGDFLALGSPCGAMHLRSPRSAYALISAYTNIFPGPIRSIQYTANGGLLLCRSATSETGPSTNRI